MLNPDLLPRMATFQMLQVDFGPGLPEPLPTDATACGGNILYVICNAVRNPHMVAV